MEKSKRSEAKLTLRMKHEDNYGMNEDSNLSHSVRMSKQGKQPRTMTLTDNKEERLRKNEGSSMHDDSCIGINYAHRFPKCFRSLHIVWIFALHFVSPIQLLSLYQFIQFLTCTRIPCEDSQCEKGLVRCCLYTSRRLQQTAVSCKRSNCNKIREKS